MGEDPVAGTNPDTDAPRAGQTAQSHAIALAGNPTILSASDGSGGTPVFALADDGTVRVIDGVMETELPLQTFTISAAPPGGVAATFLPYKMAMPLPNAERLLRGWRTLYLLALTQDGSSIHLISGFSAKSGLGAQASHTYGSFTDLGDVGLASGIAASDSGAAVVTNPILGLVYFSQGAGGPLTSVNLTKAYAVATVDQTAWVTSTAATTTGTSTGPVPVPSTGAPSGTFQGSDCNYSIVADTTGELSGGAPTCSPLVTSQPSTWARISGASWIAPAASQTITGRTGTVVGTSEVYEILFTLPTITGLSLDFTIAADDYVDVKLSNHTHDHQTVFTHTSTGMSTATTTFTLTAAQGLIAGDNLMDFYVSNAAGGPTGLLVSVANTPGGNGNLYPIDLGSQVIGTPIQVGKKPTVIQAYRPDDYSNFVYSQSASGPAGPLLYVGNSADNTISVVDPALKTVTQTIPLSASPVAIATEP